LARRLWVYVNNPTRTEESVAKEVLTFHSHRGFSPVKQNANRVEEPFQRFFLGAAQVDRNVKLVGLIELQRKNVLARKCIRREVNR